MQGRRRPQPSGTNRPSSYPSISYRRGCRLARDGCRAMLPVGSDAGSQGPSPRCAAPRARGSPRTSTPPRGGRSAAHRSAAMAGGARPDPFRTRKLSRRAPMVLRGKPVGEQGAADRWTALQYRCGAGPSGAPLLFLEALACAARSAARKPPAMRVDDNLLYKATPLPDTCDCSGRRRSGCRRVVTAYGPEGL